MTNWQISNPYTNIIIQEKTAIHSKARAKANIERQTTHKNKAISATNPHSTNDFITYPILRYLHGPSCTPSHIKNPSLPNRYTFCLSTREGKSLLCGCNNCWPFHLIEIPSKQIDQSIQHNNVIIVCGYVNSMELNTLKSMPQKNYVKIKEHHHSYKKLLAQNMEILHIIF